MVMFRDETLRNITRLTRDAYDPHDDALWSKLRSEFELDANLVPLNNVGLAPSPKRVLELQLAKTREANGDPSYTIWRKQEAELDPIHKDLATLIGCPQEELAFAPNATFGLQTAILGFDLNPGDEILYTTHDYPRVQTAARQRERRERVVRVEVALGSPPLSDEEIVRRILSMVTDRTKLVVLSRVTYLFGQILPVPIIAAELGKRKIPLVVDSAQSIGLLSDTASSLGAPILTACLHKWMMGPVGTGVFMVRQPWIKRLWPLHPADPDLDDRMKKFEQIGSHAVAPFLALRESLDFHHLVTLQAKADRIEVLRKRLAEPLLNLSGVRHYGSLDPNVCRAMLTVGFEKTPSPKLAGWLLTQHRTHVTTAVRAGVDGIRISPSIFTTFDEIDRLARILVDVSKTGI